VVRISVSSAPRGITQFADYLLTWMPWIHATYKTLLHEITNRVPSTQKNFYSSVFAATTFNFGPSAVCNAHIDHLNWAPGICAVTAGGTYNYEKGGHLVLYDLKLAVEFPPGTTILIPSACFRHGNTLIGTGEKRFAMTQYSAGGLFRWLDYGGQTERALQKQELGAVKSFKEERWQNGIDLYGKMEDLQHLWGNSIWPQKYRIDRIGGL
jgi:hypothetical protein